MTGEDDQIEEVLRKCADVHLPDDFTDRLVKRIQEGEKGETPNTSLKSVFTRIALIAASLTLLLGFVPGVFNQTHNHRMDVIAHCDGIRATHPTLPQDSQLNTLAFLGFCREIIRRRVRPLLVRSRKRE